MRKYRSTRISYATGRNGVMREDPRNIFKFYNDLQTRPSNKTIIEAREFFTDLTKNADREDQAVKILADWVNRHARYQFDSDRWGSREYWSSPFDLWGQYQEFGYFEDDCDGWSALLYWAMTLIGIPPYRVHMWTGFATLKNGQHEGHANILYHSTVAPAAHIEGSFYPGENQRNWLQYHKGHDRYAQTWFMFNEHEVII